MGADPLVLPSRCVRCGYTLEGLTGRVCPECGHQHTDEDLALDQRRWFYLQATQLEVWVGPALLLVAGAMISQWWCLGSSGSG